MKSSESIYISRSKENEEVHLHQRIVCQNYNIGPIEAPLQIPQKLTAKKVDFSKSVILWS